MMFRGTPDNPPEKYQAAITKAGARQNAYTTDDYTNYHTTFAKEDLETVLELEADRFKHLEYAEGDFMTEARAVLGEYNKSSANPFTKLIEVQRDHAYNVHTYKHTTMGFLADIEDMPNQFEYSRIFFDRWYRPEHTTIIIAGDVVADEATELIRTLWADWEAGSFGVEIPAEPKPSGPVTAHVPWPVETLPVVSVAFHAPALSETEPDHAALDMLVDLNFGETSELYKRLVQDEQKVDQLFAMYPSRKDPSLATRYGAPQGRRRCRRGARRDPGDVRARSERTVGRATPQRRQVTQQKRVLRGLDNSDSIAGTMAQFVHFRRSAETLPNLSPNTTRSRRNSSSRRQSDISNRMLLFRPRCRMATYRKRWRRSPTLWTPPARRQRRPLMSRSWSSRPPRRSCGSNCSSVAAQPTIPSERKGWPR